MEEEQDVELKSYHASLQANIEHVGIIIIFKLVGR